MTHDEHIAELILKHLCNELTPAEEGEFEAWVSADPERAAFVEQFKDVDWVVQQMKDYEEEPSAESEKKLWERVDREIYGKK